MNFMITPSPCLRSKKYKGLRIGVVVHEGEVISQTPPMGLEELLASFRNLRDNEEFGFTDEERAQLWDADGNPIITEKFEDVR